MKQIMVFLLLFVAFGLGVNAMEWQSLPSCYPDTSYTCTEFENCALIAGSYKCVAFSCPTDTVLNDWRSTEFCSSNSRVQERTVQKYQTIPSTIEVKDFGTQYIPTVECEPWIDYETQLVSSPECVLCEGKPIVVSAEIPVGCPILGKAQYRQQVKVCSIKNNLPVWIGAEKIISRDSAICSIPFLGSFFINPILAISALIVIIVFLVVLVALKRRKK